jgi:xylan 1,4-beta-xylosidase
MKGPTPTSTIRTSANGRKIGDSKPFWSLVAGAGRAAEGLRADWQQHLRQATEACGFQYVRFHGLFHDDMHIYNESDGSVFYNFQYIDALFDSMRELGVRPFVQFGFCPSQIATTLGTTFWWKGNGSPPKDMQKWVDLVRTFVEHCVDRYGIGEVEQWYFEVWNEVSLPSHSSFNRPYDALTHDNNSQT